MRMVVLLAETDIVSDFRCYLHIQKCYVNACACAAPPRLSAANTSCLCTFHIPYVKNTLETQEPVTTMNKQ